MQLVKVRNWDRNFECAQSRKVAGPLKFVAVPTKHDGKSYRRLMAHANGQAIYCAWILIVQVAAKCPTRGILADDDGPLTAEDLFIKTGCPSTLFEEAFEVLTSKPIGWLEITESTPDSAQNGSTLPRATTGVAYINQPTNQPDSNDRNQPTNQPDSGLVGGLVGLKILEEVRDEHLSNTPALIEFHLRASKERPDRVTPDRDGLLKVLGAAERSIEDGEKPARMFSGILRKAAWNHITADQRVRARRRLADHESRAGPVKFEPNRNVPQESSPAQESDGNRETTPPEP